MLGLDLLYFYKNKQSLLLPRLPVADYNTAVTQRTPNKGTRNMSAKCVYGESRSWDKNYYAYGVTNNRVVLVRCKTADDAEFERGRLKASNSTTVGSVTKTPVEEMEMRKACRQRGWIIEVIRNFA